MRSPILFVALLVLAMLFVRNPAGTVANSFLRGVGWHASRHVVDGVFRSRRR